MSAWSRIDAADRSDTPRLRLAGEGPLLGEITTWRDQLRDPGSVEICGFVEDIAAFYESCSLLVLPSSSEGFGLAAAEASSCGLAVIAADASSLPEIVIHRDTGLLIPVDRPDALAEAITQLLDDPEEAGRMGARGRERILARFDRHHTLDRLLELTGHPNPNGKGKPSCSS